MKKELKNLLENMAENDINNLTKFSSEDKSGELNDIIKEVGLLNNSVKLENDITEKERRFKLDESRQEEEIKIKELAYLLEKRKLDFEEKKFEYEKNKFEQESIENKKNRKYDKILNIILDIIKIGLPITAYVGLTILTLKLTYKDHGMVPSEIRDFIRDISRLK